MSSQQKDYKPFYPRYTAIYYKPDALGIIKLMRFECLEGETIVRALQRLEIDKMTHIVFEDWPMTASEAEETGIL